MDTQYRQMVNGICEGSMIIAGGTFILLVIIFMAFLVRADNFNPGVYSIDSSPFGNSYSEWSAKWFQFLVQNPSNTNPVNDKSGVFCSKNQNGPVWFLVGSLQGAAVRKCTLPAGKALFFPALATECSYAEDTTLKTETQLRTCAINDDQGGIPQISVDGVKLQSLENYKIQSPLFSLVFPKNNIFGAPPGATQSVSDGIFVMLHPLSIGNHTVHFSGVVIGNPTLGTQSFATDATYDLTIR